MKVTKLACVVLSLAMPATATQSAPLRWESRVSLHWVEYYADQYQVSVDLVMAIIDEESAWNPYAVSAKGALGLMQLMPQTALRFGVRNPFRVDENIRGGVAYLARLHRELGGDLRLVAAAYYVGEDPILRRGLAYSSAEVQGYVRRVAERYRARRRRAVNSAAANGGGGIQ
jgi:soluble lytic murein transglycosylase-like protein